MNAFYLSLLPFVLTACATSPYGLSAISYSTEDLKPATRNIASTNPAKKSKTYLSLDLPYAAFEKMRQEVELKEKATLKHRNEAHITVVTPPEYKKLKNKLSMAEIEALADSMGINKSTYKLICIGKGSAKEDATYFAVIQSDQLFQIRKAIEILYLKKGGAKESFQAENFHPHVTLGFTTKDLHLEDGVKKDASACLYALHPDTTPKSGS